MPPGYSGGLVRGASGGSGGTDSAERLPGLGLLRWSLVKQGLELVVGLASRSSLVSLVRRGELVPSASFFGFQSTQEGRAGAAEGDDYFTWLV